MTDEADSLRLDAFLGPDRTDALARQVAGTVPAGMGGLVSGAIAQAVKSALHIDLLALFAEGWRTAKEIHDARDAEGVTVLKLGAHSVTRDIQPVLDIAGRKQSIGLSIAITGAFEGVELSIAQGCITAVGSGTCALTLKVEFAGQPVDDPIELTKRKLPGEHPFVPGLRIP